MTERPVILLAERDVIVRMPVAAYLRECGYQVIEVVDSDEALAVLQETALSVDVSFIDVALAGTLDGFGLAQWVRQHRAEVQIVMAGSPVKAANEAGKLCEEGPALIKPYDHQLLERHIRQLLAARGRANTSPQKP
jgi:DNA-binding response OmpR family regulator